MKARFRPRIVEKRHRRRRAFAPRQCRHLCQHDLGDEGQIEPAQVVQRHPLQVVQLIRRRAEIIRIADQRGGFGQKEPRIEPAGIAGRGDGAKDETQRVTGGTVAATGKALPVGGRIGPWRGQAKPQPGLFPQFADRGGGQSGGVGPRLRAKPGHTGGIQRQRQRGQRITFVNRTAGKDELARHEGRTGAALAHQHRQTRAAPAQQDQGGGITDRCIGHLALPHGLVP